MKLSEILHPGEFRSTRNPEDVEIQEIVSDTAQVTPGCLFVCIRGLRFDSHQYLSYISGCGAAAVIVERGCGFQRIPSLPIFEVADSRIALAYAWSRFCGCPEQKLHMIGVTGTNGKTTTSYMIRSLLIGHGIKCGLIGTVEFLGDREEPDRFRARKTGKASTMTTPDPEVLYPLLREMADAGLTHCVMEVSSHSLSLGKVAPIRFRESVFTNLSPEHLDFHHTMDEYLSAKRRLFFASDTAVINDDSPYAPKIRSGLPCRIVTCSTEHEANVRTADVKLLGIHGVSYIYRTASSAFPVEVQIPGMFTVYNSLLAVTAAIEAGVPLASAKRSVATIRGICGRMERISNIDDPFSVFIDFAHTEFALRTLLTTVRAFREKDQRIVLLFGCGGDRDRNKRAPMGRAAEELADFTIVTSDNSRSEDPKQIIKEILTGMPNQKKRKVIVNRENAIRYAVLSAKPGDILLLVGKGHENYEISGGMTREFDERKVVFDALERRRSGHTMTAIGQ